MKKASREALEAYYREGDTWANNNSDALRSSRRVAWIIAAIAVVVVLAEAVAIAMLAPLKTVIPYTLLVDKQTGFVQTLKPVEENRIAPDTALTQSFLVQYVIARESFDIDAMQTNYRKVALWSADTARSDYLGLVQVSNPNSPLVRYPRTTIVETRVKSVSPLGVRAALVRFETQRRDAGGQLGPAQPYVAVVRYRFSGAPMSVEDRFLNPLGFQVLRYRRDAEALPSIEPSSSAQPSPSVVTVPRAAIVTSPAADTKPQLVRPSSSSSATRGVVTAP